VHRAREHGVPVSVDPNHRPQLWSAAEAAPVLRDLAAHADVLLLSDEDADVLFPGHPPEAVLHAALALGASTVVLKRGDRGAIGTDGGDTVEVPVAPAGPAVDPVGAGDAFDAGFLAAHLQGLTLADRLRLGAYCGARAIEAPGEHDAAPRFADLPVDLAALLRPPEHRTAATTYPTESSDRSNTSGPPEAP
jgi:2-dehydro-3-deoxygluconokinase